MKRFLAALCIGMLAIPVIKVCAAQVEPVFMEVRDYNAIELPEGTFIGVESAQEISTQYCQEGYKVYFISTNDFYVDDTNVVPENTTFVGYVEEVHDPVVGTNGSFKVRITKMILPDKYEIPVNAYIYTSNGNMVGGEMSAPAAWRKMPHYQSKIGNNTTLQLRPGRERQKGSHAIILSGEDRLIILTKPLTITHTVTD
ncbi:hypothetical protein IKP85_04410 [bacterium]|nr:hypothetical protein [bacterium]